MYVVYAIINKQSGRKYYGITKNFKRRMASHKYAALSGSYKSPIYDSIRSYGWDGFDKVILHEGLSPEQAGKIEIDLIANDDKCYNLHLGGKIGFDARLLPEERVANWKAAMKKARQGRTPAKGMKHSEENKKVFADVSRKYWDSQETYDPVQVCSVPFREASKLYGVSKTHYHRLRKRLSLSATE